jgi:transposase
MPLEVIPLRLGIDEFRVLAADEREDVVEVVIETVVPANCCRVCGCVDSRPKERKTVCVRDIPLRPGKQTWLIWWKRRFTCSRCHTTFTEKCDSILPRATHTRRFDRYLAARATEAPFAHIAEEEGVTFYRVDKASRLAAQRLLENPMSSPPTRLCIDEQSHRRGQIYNTIFSDPDGRRVIDLIEGRRQAPVQDFLDSLSNQVKAGIQEIVIDMFEPYRRAVTLALPNARLVLDRFHTERVVTKALDKVRRDLQQQLRRPGRHQGYNPPRRKLFYARHKLMRGKRRLTLTDLEELAELFTDYPELECAWQLVWRFRLVYAAADRQQAIDRLHQWYSDVDESGLLPFVRGGAAVIRAWEDEFLAYFDSRLTNAYAEGITNKIKVIKRAGYGFTNFGNFRRRVLVACG